MTVYHSRKKRTLSMSTLQRPTPHARLVLYVQANGRCFYCGNDIPLHAGTVDHLVPIRQGGGSTGDNLVFACRPCNQAKGHMNLEEYRAACGVEGFWGERSIVLCPTDTGDPAL